MDTKTTQYNQRNRFLKLSLKKNHKANKLKDLEASSKHNRSSDVIILDESFDRLSSDYSKTATSKLFSPIVINDSCDLDNDLPVIVLSESEPSKVGNVSFNTSFKSPSPTKESRPSIGGWSPAQNIICATPRHEPTPTTPRDLFNESQEKCSIKTVQLSQKKLLNDLYGETWKSIPKLFKTISKNYENYDPVKKLNFDDESDKENIRKDLKQNKLLYLTNSDVKRKEILTESERKSKKKLYTEKVPSTPEVPKIRVRNVNSTTKKNKVNKAMSVTEMVGLMRDDVGLLAKKVEKVAVTPNVARLSFVGSLAENIPSWRCHTEAIQYHDNFKNLKEQLARRLFIEFNENVFDNAMDADLPILWDTKLRTTAGTTTNRLIKNAKGDRIRTSSIKLSCKVLDLPQRVRDTLIHELCHAATWLIDSQLKAGHGPLWNKCIKLSCKVLDLPQRVRDTLIHELCHVATWLIDSQLKAGHGPLWNKCIKLSCKVLDLPQRVRDTLIHELCHVATWLIDSQLKAGHGPLWNKWAKRALRVYPELGEISRCHDMEIHFKYQYKCTKCGYSVQRHSKSIDITKKCCGYCRGTFELILNKKNKDGVIISTPARKGTTNDFAMYVKENYALHKNGKTHAQVMKLLGEEFKKKSCDNKS